MGVGKGGQGGHAPLDFHTLYLKPRKFQKLLHFLLINTGSILIPP